MPVGELVMHFGISKNPPTLGVVTKIYVEGGRNRYMVVWLNSRYPGDMSTKIEKDYNGFLIEIL